jgi:uncharacterized protein
MQRVNWMAVLTFILLACAWSWPFFWWRDMHSESWMAWRFPMPLKNTLLMWGPGIAALICFWLFRKNHQRSISIFGQTRLRSLVFYFLPMIALAIVGIRITEMGPGIVHAMVIAIAVVGMINILGEELGWRGFLQDALRPLPKSARYIVIGLVWAGWHFTNLFAHLEGQELWMYLAWYLPLTIVLSALIGEAADRTRAVLVAVTLHAWLDFLWEFPGTGTYAVFAGSILFWFWMLKNWPRRTPD